MQQLFYNRKESTNKMRLFDLQGLEYRVSLTLTLTLTLIVTLTVTLTLILVSILNLNP